MTELESWEVLWRDVTEVVIDEVDREIWRNLSQHLSFAGRSLLELGCGRGLLSRFAAAAGARGVTLLDSSTEALRVSRRLFEGVDGVRFVHGDLLEYRGEERFDIVLSSGTVEHFEGERLLECLRVHRDHARGRIAVIVPAAPHPNTFIANRRRFIETYGYERPISLRQMRSLLQCVGLRPLVLRRFHPLYNITARWLAPRTGLGPLDHVIDRCAGRADRLAGRLGVRERLVRAMRPFDRRLGGLLLAIAAPPTALDGVALDGR